MLIIYQNVNPSKLHDELISAGIIPISVLSNIKDGEHIAEKTWITFKDGEDKDLISQIVVNHDPSLLPNPPSQTEIMEQRIADLELILVEMMFN